MRLIKPLNHIKFDFNFPTDFTVLIVEDEKVNLSVAIRLLEMFGIKHMSAKNGEEAIKTIDENGEKINLILMDIQLTGMDGYKTTAKIKSSNFAKIPIIAMTACARNEDKYKCFRVGCDDYISKPFGVEELLCKIKRWGSISLKKQKLKNKQQFDDDC